MSSTTLLSLNKLSVWYTAGHPVLSGLSLDLGEHEVVGLIGLNGAGKTTFIKTVAGLLPGCHLNEATWDGHPFSFRRSSGAGILSLRRIGRFRISHSGSIWRMWLRPMAWLCRM